MLDIYLLVLLGVVVAKAIGHTIDLAVGTAKGKNPGTFDRESQPGK